MIGVSDAGLVKRALAVSSAPFSNNSDLTMISIANLSQSFQYYSIYSSVSLLNWTHLSCGWFGKLAFYKHLFVNCCLSVFILFPVYLTNSRNVIDLASVINLASHVSLGRFSPWTVDVVLAEIVDDSCRVLPRRHLHSRLRSIRRRPHDASALHFARYQILAILFLFCL